MLWASLFISQLPRLWCGDSSNSIVCLVWLDCKLFGTGLSLTMWLGPGSATVIKKIKIIKFRFISKNGWKLETRGLWEKSVVLRIWSNLTQQKEVPILLWTSQHYGHTASVMSQQLGWVVGVGAGTQDLEPWSQSQKREPRGQSWSQEASRQGGL